MPPSKGAVWKYFNEIKDDQGIILKVSCKFCKKEYKYPNATRMEIHLVNNCNMCPENIKEVFSSGDNSSFLDSSKESEEMVLQKEIDTYSAATSNGSASVPSTTSPQDQHQPATKKRKISHFLDSVSKEQKKELDKLFARAVYSKGCALSIFEGDHMREAFRKLRPAYVPPSHQELGGKLLETEYAEVMTDVQGKIKGAVCLTLMSDGWTNRRSEGIVNFVLGTPEPVFYKSVEVGAQREDALFVSSQLLKIIDEVGATNVLFIVTDNASVMRSAWQSVHSVYPHIYSFGCGSHGLNLLFKDFMNTILLKDLFDNAKAVVKIKKKRFAYAVFKEKQREKYGDKVYALTLPAVTRFFGAYLCFVSLQRNKAALQETVIKENINIDNHVRGIVLDNNGFWTNINFAVDFLKPLADGIQLLEANDAKLSHTVAILMHIRAKVNSLDDDDDSPLTLADSRTISVKVNQRIKFCLRNVHLATYLIDPHFLGKGLSDEEVLAATGIITNIAVFLKLNEAKILDNLLDLRTKSGFFSKDVLWNIAKTSESLKWWQGFCSQQALYPIAARLLSAVPTSTSCERIWSAYEHIHSKKRNKLLNETTEKLVSVKCNLNVLSGKMSKQSDGFKERYKILSAFASHPLFGVPVNRTQPDQEADESSDDHERNSDCSDSDYLNLTSDDDCFIDVLCIDFRETRVTHFVKEYLLLHYYRSMII